MIIPLWALLIPAAILVFFVVAFAFINLLQLSRFGFMGLVALLAFGLFVAAALVVGSQTVAALQGVDWNAPFITLKIGGSSDIFGI